MSAKDVYDQVEQTLTASRTNLRCNELSNLLTQLGFEVRDGKRGGHKVFFHDAIPEFMSSSFNCGHGKNPEIKPAYIGKILRTIRQYEAEIVAHLQETRA